MGVWELSGGGGGGGYSGRIDTPKAMKDCLGRGENPPFPLKPVQFLFQPARQQTTALQ